MHDTSINSFFQYSLYIWLALGFCLEIHADATMKARYDYIKNEVFSSVNETEIEQAVDMMQLYACDMNKPELLTDLLAEVQIKIDWYEVRIAPRVNYGLVAKSVGCLVIGGACFYYLYKTYTDNVWPAQARLKEVESDLNKLGAEMYEQIEAFREYFGGMHVNTDVWRTYRARMLDDTQVTKPVTQKADLWKQYNKQLHADRSLEPLSVLGGFISSIFASYYTYYACATDLEKEYKRHCMLKAKILQAQTEFEKVRSEWSFHLSNYFEQSLRNSILSDG